MRLLVESTGKKPILVQRKICLANYYNFVMMRGAYE